MECINTLVECHVQNDAFLSRQKICRDFFNFYELLYREVNSTSSIDEGPNWYLPPFYLNHSDSNMYGLNSIRTITKRVGKRADYKINTNGIHLNTNFNSA